MIRSQVIYEPRVEPVSLVETKEKIYVTESDRDSTIERLITVARRMCEEYSGLSFITQTRVVKLGSFGRLEQSIIHIPNGPIQAISGEDSDENTLGISYIDTNGNPQTLALGTGFTVDTHSSIPRIAPVNCWPSVSTDILLPITVTYVAGYAAPENVPAEAKEAILAQVGYMYNDPEGAGGLCRAAQDFLDYIKVYFHES